MRQVIILAVLLLTTTVCEATLIKSTRFGTAIEVSRIVEMVKLVSRPEIQVNAVVRDLGGSTDVSPTQELFLTLYAKGEMFSTDATFKLGAIYDFKSARRISPGVYEIYIGGIDYETSMPKNMLLIIDAQKAISDMLKVRCVDFDCPASDEFESTIDLTLKK